MSAGYKVFGWTDLQWATVQEHYDAFESIEDMMEAMVDWRRQNKPEPVSASEPVRQHYVIVMQSVYASCAMLGERNVNLDALEAAAKKAIQIPSKIPSQTTGSGYSDGGFALGLCLGLNL